MKRINIQAAYQWVEHELRRTKRHKQRSKAFNRIHRRRIMRAYKESFLESEEEDPEAIEVTITNYVVEMNNKKEWFVSLQQATDYLYYNYKELFLSTKTPTDYITSVVKTLKLYPITKQTTIQGDINLKDVDITDNLYPHID